MQNQRVYNISVHRKRRETGSGIRVHLYFFMFKHEQKELKLQKNKIYFYISGTEGVWEMTVQEACRNYQMTEKSLKEYEENGLVKARETENGTADYRESDLQNIVRVRFLIDAGMNLEEIRHFLELQEDRNAGWKEQVRILRKFRFELLDGIHLKQQSLDRLDYFIHEIRNQ